jgi:hypothetical protein
MCLNWGASISMNEIGYGLNGIQRLECSDSAREEGDTSG